MNAFLFLFFYKIWCVGKLIDFDTFQPTPKNGIPGNNSEWVYTTERTNPRTVCGNGQRASQFCKTGAGSSSSYYESIKLYSNPYNSDHMGWENFGFLEISSFSVGKNGNSLKYSVTGGKNSDSCPDPETNCPGIGKQILSKEEFLETPDAVDQTNTKKVGCPYLYFLTPQEKPFEKAPGSNKLSMYYYMPESVTNGEGGYANPPRSTLTIGPFNDVGGHWYSNFLIQGGGWTHILVDAHPQHNNAFSDSTKYPYPSWSVRDYGYDYFNSMYRFYAAFSPYSGLAVPPFSVYFDEIEFFNDTEPQNEETIASLGVMYKGDTNHTFEMSFMDKYKNNQYSHSTYQVKYSFSQITNANWDNSIEVKILKDERYGIEERDDGKFQKWHAYYQNCWCSFTLKNEDHSKLTKGTIIYFAVKDISQVNGTGKIGIDSITNKNTGGRDYENHGDTMDYEGDKPALNLIKRIDFKIPFNIPTEDTNEIETIDPITVVAIVLVSIFSIIFFVILFGIAFGSIIFFANFKKKSITKM